MKFINKILSYLLCFISYFLAEANKYNQAIKLVDKSIVIYPEYTYAYYLKAFCCIKTENYKESSKYFEKYLSIEKDLEQNKKLHIVRMLIVAYFKEENYSKTEEYLREEIELNPNNAFSHTGLARSLRKQGKIEEAIKEFELSTKLDSKYDFPYINLAQIFSDREDYEKALHYTDEYLKLQPNDLETINCKIQLLENLNRQEEAEKLKEEVKKLQSN